MVKRLAFSILTLLTEVIHQQDLAQVFLRRSVKHAVHSAQERGPSLVMETDDHARSGQSITVALSKTPVI